MELSAAASTYCLWKSWFSIVGACVAAVVLLALAVMVPRWMGDTSKFVPATAAVVPGGDTIAQSGNGGNQWSARYKVTYVASDGKTYTAFTESGTSYPDRSSAAAALAAATGTTRKLFYDPADPAKTTAVRNVENYVGAGLGAAAAVAAGSAVLVYFLRNNAVFCGLGIAADASSVLFGR